MSVAQSSSATPAARQQQEETFEFTKRKRWADLLINELADAIILILSPACKVLFCGPAVTELLGWRDEDLVDNDFVDLLNLDDQANFRSSFNASVQTKDELLSYFRLKCKNQFTSPEFSSGPTDVLVEFKGYPHFIPEEDECKCFFAVAKPYPSRNTAMLNTFLELKLENERLQQRLAELRTHPMSSTGVNYGAPSIPPPGSDPSTMTVPSQGPGNLSNQYHSGITGSGGYDSLGQRRSSIDAGNLASYGDRFTSASLSSSADGDLTEDGGKKKKLKKTHVSEQHVCVTCGRTDSPEWRKGPLGPKTLCNACGLRWAKQMRRFDDVTEGNGESSQGTGSSSSTAP